MRAITDYGTHKCAERLTLDEDLFCPSCGTKGQVWIATEGDYYTGPDHYCLSCRSRWSMPSGPEEVSENVSFDCAEELDQLA